MFYFPFTSHYFILFLHLKRFLIPSLSQVFLKKNFKLNLFIYILIFFPKIYFIYTLTFFGVPLNQPTIIFSSRIVLYNRTIFPLHLYNISRIFSPAIKTTVIQDSRSCNKDYNKSAIKKIFSIVTQEKSRGMYNLLLDIEIIRFHLYSWKLIYSSRWYKSDILWISKQKVSKSNRFGPITHSYSERYTSYLIHFIPKPSYRISQQALRWISTCLLNYVPLRT